MSEKSIYSIKYKRYCYMRKNLQMKKSLLFSVVNCSDLLRRSGASCIKDLGYYYTYPAVFSKSPQAITYSGAKCDQSKSTTRKQIPKQRVKYVYVFIVPSTPKDVKTPLKAKLFRNKG